MERSESISGGEFLLEADDLKHPSDDNQTIVEYDPAQDPAVSAGIQEERIGAVTIWVKRTWVLCLLQAAAMLALVVGKFFYSSAVNLGLVVAGMAAAKFKRHEYAFVYLLLNCANICKDIGLLVLWPDDTLSIALVLFDLCLVSPAGIYASYYLYQTIRSVVSVVN